MSFATLSKIDIQPKLDVTFLHVTDATMVGNSYDGHEVGTFSPSLAISRSGQVWTSSLEAEHTFIQQYQYGYDDTEFTNLSLNNTLSFWQNRLTFTNGIDRQNRNVDTSLGAAADPIFGQSEFVDVDTVTNQISLNTGARSNWRSAFSLNQSVTHFDESQLQETDTTVSNLSQGESKSALLSISYGQQANHIRGSVESTFSRSDRLNRGEQDSLNIAANLGIPLGGDIDLVVHGNKNKNIILNSLISNSDLENESYGAGLAWRFGQRSNIELTYNKESRGDGENFVGYKFEMFPSARSTVVYEQSKRFYGESHSFNLAHNARRWNVSINYGENLASQTRIDRSTIDLGNFLCPEDLGSIADCTSIDVLPDTVEEGFIIAAFSEPVFALEEEFVLSKSASASIGYQFKKANLMFTYGQSETEYLEREGLRDSTTRSVNYTHTMTRRNTLTISASDSDSTQWNETSSNAITRQDRTSYNINATFSRKMSRKATGSMSLVKYSSQSTTGKLNREDTRLEMKYSYTF